jgi:hypothetical protein
MSVLTTQKTTELIGSETSKDFMGRRNASNTDTNPSKDIKRLPVTRPTEIPPDVLKKAIKDFSGLQGGVRCVAAFVFDRDASSACETADPTLVAAVTVVLSLYVLFFFAPFYMFPEAAIALGAWKLYPLLEKDIMASPKDTDVPDAMREALFLSALLGFVSRCFTLWNERNEAKAAGRQSSMLVSIIMGFVIFVIFNVLSA